MANRLTDDFAGATVVGLRSPGVTDQARRTLFVEQGPELKVSLRTVAELLRGAVGYGSDAFPFNQHRDFEAQVVVLENVQAAPRAEERLWINSKGHKGSSIGNG